MIIPINDKWRITSDSRQFILQKHAGTDKDTGELIWKPESYHPDLKQLVRSVAYKELRGGGDETLSQALERVEKLVVSLCTALKPLLTIKMNTK